MAFEKVVKDPDATLDYKVDWSSWLGTDTIASATWVVPSGLNEVTSGNTTTTATVWLSGGTLKKTYLVTSRITTAAGRINDYSFNVSVQTT